ncbi:MAG TPA: hypothetical protein GX717_06770, partial [Clostridiaceae bacterium]|nr:hypothetical protein [Clostridiaceae bacterium]
AKMADSASDTVVALSDLIQRLADLLSSLVDKIPGPLKSILQVGKVLHGVSGTVNSISKKRERRKRKKKK